MFTSNDGYRLGLDASHVATSTSALSGGGISALINTALTYNSTSGTIDNNESTAGYGSFAAYVNSEIGKLDDVGFVQEGSDDAKLNIDYANDAAVLFNIPATGLMKLLIAEDAGWIRSSWSTAPGAPAAPLVRRCSMDGQIRERKRTVLSDVKWFRAGRCAKSEQLHE
jgi:hypothetical protein